jgi:hypothetical protein
VHGLKLIGRGTESVNSNGRKNMLTSAQRTIQPIAMYSCQLSFVRMDKVTGTTMFPTLEPKEWFVVILGAAIMVVSIFGR